jgi:site-specific DNA-adenine methylase
MRNRREAAIAHARRVLAVSRGGTEVEKTIWGSPAGKKRLADRLVAMLPAHKTYVEPFAGSAAVLFAKEPSEVEVINDADPEIAEAYRLLKKLTPDGLERLKKLPWVGDEKTFKGLLDAEPEDDVERLHRFLYLTHFSYGKMRGRSFSPSVIGVEAKTIQRIEQYAPRLERVKVYGGDYEKVVRKYDAKDTVFFLDPPYPGYNVDVGESEFDEERFFKLLKSLKGKFLITYGIRGKFPELVKDSGFWVKRIRTPRTIAAMRGVGGSSVLTQLLVANYEPTLKGLDDSVLVDDWDGTLEDDAAELEKAQPFGTFGGSFHYAKRIVPLIPAHKTYVEPFAGAAAVLYAKEPSAKEVLADLDDDVVFLHRSIKAMTPERVAELRRRFEWTVTEESFAKARDMAPRDDVARFYKLVFVRTHARDCRPDGTHPAQQHLGSTTNPEKYLKAAERLKDVTILRQDYKKTLESLDAPDTFFFIDPPYPGEWFDKDKVIDLEEFVDALAKVKGKFIAVLNPTPENVAAFKKRRPRLPAQGARGLGARRRQAGHAPLRRELPRAQGRGRRARLQVRAPPARPERGRAGLRQDHAAREGHRPERRALRARHRARARGGRCAGRHLLGRRDPRRRASFHGGIRRPRAHAPHARQRPGEGARELPRADRLQHRRHHGAQGHVDVRRPRALRRAVGARQERRAHRLFHRRLRASRTRAGTRAREP